MSANPATAAPEDMESFRMFREDLVKLQLRTDAEVRQAFAGARRWLATLPTLRYLGELPCWRATCPRCKSQDNLWVDVWEEIAGIGEGWTCAGCHCTGETPESLAAFVADAPEGAAS